MGAFICPKQHELWAGNRERSMNDDSAVGLRLRKSGRYGEHYLLFSFGIQC
jgi:hypothetical protein